MTILIVDDKTENLYLLETLLKSNGYSTIPARNGAEALGLATKEKPDLIITDILMPVMDGYTFCRECKKDKKLKNIPFIFYTATYTDPKDEIFALSLGADRFILKPQEPDAFLDIINQCLNEFKEKNEQPARAAELQETVILKEYNQTLIRKLEDKMRQTEENERRLKAYVQELKDSLEERKRVEMALRASEEKYRLIQENSLDAILLSSTDGAILSANNAACEMFEMSEKEICSLGRNGLIDLSDPNVSVLLNERELTGKAKGELTLIRKNNKKFSAEISTSVFTDSSGEKRTSMIIRDITSRKKAEMALSESEKKYRTLINQSLDGIFIISLDGNFLSVNQSMCDQLKYGEEELLSMKIWDIVPKEYEEQFLKRLKKITAGIVLNETIEYKVISKDGTEKYIEVLSAPYYKEDELIGFQGIARDITERKLAQNQIILLAHALKSTSECISITDNNDIITFVNEAFLKTYGFTEKELLGKHISIVRPNDNTMKDQFKDILTGTLKGGWKGEIINRKKNGSLFPVLLSTSIIKDDNNNAIARIGAATDITEIKKTREELILAKEKAELSDKLKSDFLAQISHEIRTPMNVSLSFLSILKDELSGKMTEDLNEFFVGIESANKRLIRTVDLIINVAEMQRGTYEPTFTKISLIEEIINEIKNDYEPLIKNKGITLKYESDVSEVFIFGDMYSVHQIFENLIDNAAKYTKEGFIKIAIKDDEMNKEVLVSIEDSGIGISQEYMANIFKPFMQEDRGYSRRFEGNGLGMSLVKQYCNLNNATIDVKSEKGKGSKFTVKFKRNFK